MSFFDSGGEMGDPPSDPGTTPGGSGNRSSEQMVELTRSECVALLATERLGRLAVTLGDMPVMRPVNYIFDGPSQSVMFRTARGSKFHALVHATRAVFEIDAIDAVTHSGWSVIVTGVTKEVTNAAELRRLNGLGLDTLAPGPKPHWIGIRAWTVSGRRILP